MKETHPQKQKRSFKRSRNCEDAKKCEIVESWKRCEHCTRHSYPPPPFCDRTRGCMPRSQTAWRGSECGAPKPDFPNERHSVGP